MKAKHFEVYFGGTFDPPHLGHAAILNSLLKRDDVECVHLVPTGLNPLKNASSKVLGTLEDRKRWIDLWLQSEKISHSFEISKLKVEYLELESTTVSQYTHDTLQELKKHSSTKKLWVMVLGEDSLENLHLWKNASELLKNEISEVWVYSRGQLRNPLTKIPNEMRPLCQWRWIPVEIPEVSSTDIRAFLREPGFNALQKLDELKVLRSIKEDLKRLVL